MRMAKSSLKYPTAEGGFPIINQPIDQFIQCIHCNKLFGKDYIDDNAILAIEDFFDKIRDTAVGCEYLDDFIFDAVNAPCEISCPFCFKIFKTVAHVSARPDWNYDEYMEGRVPRICHFDDIEVLGISSAFEISPSIPECFKFDIDIETPDDFEINGCIDEYALHSDVVPISIILRIIAKTNMSTKFCYLGLHESTGRIYRPIFNTIGHKCGWPRNEQLEFGMLYIFSVVAHPGNMKYFTPFPHCNEDMIVNGFSILEPQVTCFNSVYQSLLPVVKSDVREVFKDIRLKSYVDEQTLCSSVGVIRSEAMIRFNDYMEKDYCHIRCPSGLYSFPITASQFDDIGAEYRDAVIILGLGRPYKGRKGQHKPARCIVLAVGIYLPEYTWLYYQFENTFRL